jgi:hypothetical protein
LLTCISPPLVFADRLKGGVLQPPDLGLQEPQVDHGRSTVVIALGVGHRLTRDAEDRDAPAVGPAHLDVQKLAAAQKAEGAQE